MARIVTFQAPRGTVNIEVSEEDGPSGTKNLSEVARVVAAMVEALGAELNKLPEEKIPGEILVSFGVVTFARGSAAISLNEEKANFRIRFKWSGEGMPEDFS
ncbi:hypothetical protein [Nitrosomonas communis]|uniref:Trypsin-co-occurring domain-containing protein n=1 Tax=Nitrosomonas communis TaxID=44574 RepID=A0A1I4U0R8_9PROT|nr:hypothetical protein [Nitrosomonas communis]SFM82477.1 hypothetical protein SAMN05421863_105718 [Nitrosomonas communis]